MKKYDYLKRFVYDPKTYPDEGLEFNLCFSKVIKEEIVEAEKKSKIKFPDSLKELWLEIGGGYIG